MGRVAARDDMAEAVVTIDAGPFEIEGATKAEVKVKR